MANKRSLSVITGVESYSKKRLCVGIPAYHCEPTVEDTLSSINMQSIRDDIEVVISPDDDHDYNYLKSLYKNLDITILPNPEVNAGPGVARQKVLNYLYDTNSKTEWVTFIDADDVFFTPHSLESLMLKAKNTVCVQGIFLQELDGNTYRNIGGTQPRQMSPQDPHIVNPNRFMPDPSVNPFHPWVFGRIYNVKYLKDNNITFGTLRAMEDGFFNQHLRMLSADTNKRTVYASEQVYLWRVGSEHSITRVGIKENGGIPLYNYDLCPVGATVSFMDALYLVKQKHPISQAVSEAVAQHMVGQYTSYEDCLEERPLFSKQALFNAKRFYLLYKEIEPLMTKDYLFTNMAQAYMQYAAKYGKAPRYTFDEFMELIKSEPYGGKEEWDEIRSELPQWVIDLDMKSGVLGSEGFIESLYEKDNPVK